LPNSELTRDGFAEARKQMNKKATVPISDRRRILLSDESIMSHTKNPIKSARKKALKLPDDKPKRKNQTSVEQENF
jgi:hypothetical protein